MQTASLTDRAEQEWLRAFAAGPTEATPATQVRVGDPAPDAALTDHDGNRVRLRELWGSGPALLVFWRHFGCGCGVERAARLREEHPCLVDAGVTVVVIGMGEPSRAAAYRTAQGLPCPVLSDPDQQVYRRYGLGEWQPAQVLYDAPARFLAHEREDGERLARDRRAAGMPLVDNPWRETGEFLVGRDGRIRLAYRYQYCADYPDPRLVPALLGGSAEATQDATSAMP